MHLGSGFLESLLATVLVVIVVVEGVLGGGPQPEDAAHVVVLLELLLLGLAVVLLLDLVTATHDLRVEVTPQLDLGVLAVCHQTLRFVIQLGGGLSR